MITSLFLSFFEVSLSASLIALLLILSAPLLNKRYAAKWKYWIWLFLALRLALPVSGDALAATADAVRGALWKNEPLLEKEASPKNEVLAENGVEAYEVTPESGAIQEEWRPEQRQSWGGMNAPGQETLVWRFLVKVPEQLTTPLITLWGGARLALLDIAALVWLAGFLCLLCTHGLSYGHCRRQIMREGRALTEGAVPDLASRLSEELGIKRPAPVIVCEGTGSPMVIGFLKPVLVLPGEQYSEQELYFILKHELIHLKRHDVFFKLLMTAASILHWFNPVVWLMQREASVDMELSCDERVVLGEEYAVRKAYTETLLTALHRKKAGRVVLSTQFYGGKRVMKKRFTNILLWAGKKNGLAVLVCAVVLTVSLGAMIGCSAVSTEEPEGEPQSEIVQPVKDGNAAPSGPEISDDSTGGNGSDEIRVFEEIEDGEIRYQARRDGIYRLEGDGEKQIYDIFAGTGPQMTLFEGRLYFMTDALYQDDALDWQDTTIRWIDLQTLEIGDLQMVRKDSLIASFHIWQGIVTIRYAYPDVADSLMLYISEDTVWDGKSILELSDAEKQSYGQRLTQAVLQEQSALTNVSNRVPNRNLSYLDMDGDGVSEEIVLEAWREGGEIAPDDPLAFYRVRIGEAVLEAYGYATDNTLRAFSLDGETLILAVYEDGPSADPLTHFYQYRNGQIVEVGSMETDIHSCRLEQGGILSGAIFKEIANSDWIRVSWRMGADGMLEEVAQEYYDFIRGNWVELCEELPLRTEAGGGETFTVTPQQVKFLQTSADWSWLLIETEDGQQGWVHIVDYQVEELGKNVMDIFEGNYLAG